MKRSYLITISFIIFFIILVNFFPKIKNKTRSVFFNMTGDIASSFSGFGRSIKNDFSFIIHIKDLKQQNDQLTAEIINLEVDKSQIAELQTENKLLDNELGFLDKSETGTLIPARVIDREPASLLDSFIVDKGSDDGVVGDSAVVYNGVLVGKIGEVYKNQSKVILITSKDSLVQAMLQDCRANGVLRGGINGLYLENIVSDTTYKPGEYVVTSGLGGTMKQGILIGKAGTTLSSNSSIYKNISIDPIIDFSSLELVFIEK